MLIGLHASALPAVGGPGFALPQAVTSLVTTDKSRLLPVRVFGRRTAAGVFVRRLEPGYPLARFLPCARCGGHDRQANVRCFVTAGDCSPLSDTGGQLPGLGGYVGCRSWEGWFQSLGWLA